MNSLFDSCQSQPGHRGKGCYAAYDQQVGLSPRCWPVKEVLLCRPYSSHGCDVFPGACTDHSAAHQRGIMTIYIRQFPVINFLVVSPSYRRL